MTLEKGQGMCTISEGEEGRYVAQSIYDYKMNQQMKQYWLSYIEPIRNPEP